MRFANPCTAVVDVLAPICQLLVPGRRFCVMIAEDVTPFGPSDVVGGSDVVVLPVALVVVVDDVVAVVVVVVVVVVDDVVEELAAAMVGTAISTATTAPVKVSHRRRERDTPRMLITVPPRCVSRQSVLSACEVDGA